MACDVSRLASHSKASLDAAFQGGAAREHLTRLEQRLAPLELPEMTGGVNPGDQRALHLLVRALRPQRTLEIGTHVGCSTVSIALGMLDSVTDGAAQLRLLSVDLRDVNNPFTRPWTAHAARHSPRESLRLAGCAAFTTFVTADAVECLEHGDEDFDLIFLDGDHSAEGVYREVPRALRRLRAGGSILLHDYFPSGEPLWADRPPILGPWSAVERLRREGAALRALPLGELPWTTKLGTRTTTLALLVPERLPEQPQSP